MIIDTKDYLAHHGIAGQKWGVRRYQNEDGSLTPEGYEHYGINPNKKYREYEYSKEDLDDHVTEVNGKSVFKKGTKMYRFADKGEPLDEKRKYVTTSIAGMQEYSYFAIEGMLGLKTYDPEMYVFESKNDLQIKKGSAFANEVIEKYGDKSVKQAFSELGELRGLDAEELYRVDKHGRELSEKEHEKLLKKNKVKEKQIKAHRALGNTFEKNLDKILLDASKEGYDAVQDLFDNNDIFGYTRNMGASYVITNPKKSIKEVKK